MTQTRARTYPTSKKATMKYLEKQYLRTAMFTAATIVAAIWLAGCSSGIDCQVASCTGGDPTPVTLSSAPSTTTKPSTSVTRTSSVTPSTTTPALTTTRHLVETTEYPAGKLEKYSNGDVSFSASPTPTSTTTPATSSTPPVLAPTQPQAAAAPAPQQPSVQSRQFFTVHDQQGHMGGPQEEQVPGSTELYSGMGNPPSDLGGATLRSIGSSTFSELEFQSPAATPWSYIVVRKVGDDSFTGVRYNLSSNAVNALGGRVIYEFHGYDDIETIYFVP